MPRIRSIALALALLFAVALPQESEAQVKFGAHVARAADLLDGDGSFGLGARVGIAPPALPFSFFGTVDYFFPDCGDVDCGYQNFAADVNFSPFPFPMVDVYATGGLLIRRNSLEGELLGTPISLDGTATGFSIGGGVAFNFLASPYLEARYEIFGDEDGGNQLLIRLGLFF